MAGFNDQATKETDKELERLQKKIKREYRKASKELKEKYKKQLQKIEEKAKEKEAQLPSDQYQDWYEHQLEQLEYTKKMRDTLAADLTKVNEKVASITSGFLPEAYASNFNFATYKTELGSKVDTSFTLYSRETVERLMKKNTPFETPTINAAKDTAWNNKKINSVITQGVLQGKSILQIADDFETVVKINETSAMRAARTYMTGAQNAGRMDAYSRAEKYGMTVRKRWMCTHDSHTRDSHLNLDGETVGLHELFSNGLEYPGDQGGAPAEYYNCRCTMVSEVELKSSDEIKASYEEWKKAHED